MTRWLIFVVVFLISVPATARPFRQMDVPNWDDAKFGGAAGCGACHVANGGGGARTMFGMDAGMNLNTIITVNMVDESHATWADFYMNDSDGDGYSNGEELGDPMGAWAIGDANPVVATVWDPGDPADNPCGNDVIDFMEPCDGIDLGGEDCVSQGSEGVGLVCLNCTFSTNNCAVTNNNTTGTNNSNNTTGVNNSNSTNNTGINNANNGGNNGTNNNMTQGDPKNEVDGVGRTCMSVYHASVDHPWLLLSILLVTAYRRRKKRQP